MATKGSQSFARGNLIHWNNNTIDYFLQFSNSFIYLFIYAWCLLLMSSCEPLLTTSYKQRVNELYISAEVSQRDISRGAVLHRWGVAYLQRGKCLCQHKQQPVLSRHERRALWSIPSDRRGMTAWACLESDRPLTERVWWCSCNHVSVRVPKIRTTAVVTYNIFLNVTEVFLAPSMPNRVLFFGMYKWSEPTVKCLILQKDERRRRITLLRKYNSTNLSRQPAPSQHWRLAV